MLSKRIFILGLFLVMGFLLFSVSAVKAETWTWTGSGDGQTWTDAKNWGLNSAASSIVSYPGATSTVDVVIGGTAAVPVGPTVYATTTLAYGINTLTLGAANVGPKLYIGASFGASSTISILATSTLTLATSTYGAGTLNLGQTAAGAPLNLASTATFTAATGTVAYIGGGTAEIIVATTTFYNLTLATSTASAPNTPSLFTFGSASTCALGGCTATTTIQNIFTIATGTLAYFNGKAIVLSGGSATLATPFYKQGNFTALSSLVQYTSAFNVNVATGTYARLEIAGGAGTKTLLGDITNGTTVATSTVIGSDTTLAVGSTLLTLTGINDTSSTFTNNGILTIGTLGIVTAESVTWLNSGTVTNGGKIVHAGVGILSDSAGAAASVTSFGNADLYPTVHIQITDTSLNYSSATEERTATVTSTSGITDIETITLTETGTRTGIFRGSITFALSGSNVAGRLDYQGPGTVSYTWIDSQDTSDTETASASFGGTTPGGSSSSSSAAVTTTTTVTPAPTTVATTVTPAAPAATTPTVSAAPTLESVQTKVAAVIARVAALPTNPTASDLSSIQAEIAAILTELQSVQAAKPVPAGVVLGFRFVRPLALSLRHSDVSNLQNALKTDSSVYPEGLVTGYFGSATLRAVQRFQEKYGIASSGQPGYGNVGPATRAKLNALYGSK